MCARRETLKSPESNRLSAVTRVVKILFDGVVVLNLPKLSPGWAAAKRFWVKPFTEDWGKYHQGAHEDIEVGNCGTCPAAVVWPQDGHNKVLRDMRNKWKDKLICVGGPYFLGKGTKQHRPRIITKRTRCPLEGRG
jgi:hypothetical protein